jgi:hypothetical protein
MTVIHCMLGRYWCVASIPTVLALAVGKWTVPESPRRHDEAVHILRQVAERNGKDALKLFPDNVRLTAELSDVRVIFNQTYRKVTLSLVHFCHLGGRRVCLLCYRLTEQH